MGLRAFFKTAKAASICDIFWLAVFVEAGFFAVVVLAVLVAGCFLAAGFFAEAFLAGAVLVVPAVFFVAMFVFPFVWGSRYSALANGTTQLPLSRKHIQRCVRVIPKTF